MQNKCKGLICLVTLTDVLERLRKRVQRVRTDIADDWVLHHDNAPSHTALAIREFLAKKNSRTSTSSLQPRSSSVQFLPLPKVEIEVEGSSLQKTVTADLNTLTENDSSTVMISGRNVGTSV
jgi:hypothetical protein